MSSTLSASLLARDVFVVKEQVGLLKASKAYDIYDPEGGQQVMACREEELGFLTKVLRFTDYRRMTPFDVRVRTLDGALVVQVKRGISLFRSTVEVLDGNGTVLGTFRQKMLSLGGAFDVLNPEGQVVCTLQGKWTGWDFKFIAADGRELASVTKKWAGIGREMLTTADNYVLQVAPMLPPDAPARKLILAAVMCIDLVLKE